MKQKKWSNTEGASETEMDLALCSRVRKCELKIELEIFDLYLSAHQTIAKKTTVMIVLGPFCPDSSSILLQAQGANSGAVPANACIQLCPLR